jgi:hypothetical protein
MPGLFCFLENVAGAEVQVAVCAIQWPEGHCSLPRDPLFPPERSDLLALGDQVEQVEELGEADGR